MEVVLSPGRFGDEVPGGAPFQNEEIREWSHVDRLTGMLERARVETGRWKTLNHGAARSYGKVIDSRERNSADGSVVQRARRQVEVFQSEGPGRSVQVVRASQWSSSRVTDSSTTSPLAVASLAQKKNDEAISERLSTLLGSFANHASSSTVPFRRIDSKYASRTPISLPIVKRSTSNEDLTGHSNGLLAAAAAAAAAAATAAATKSSRDFEYAREIENKSEDRQRTRDSSLTNADTDGISEHCQSAIATDEPRTITNRAAIQLLPSSKANTTVVNLINDSSSNSQAETMDVREGAATTTTVATAPSPRRDSRVEESATPGQPAAGKPVKRVGFCKTEIHFAADSGKVNIVETDGKPPPTNKFRRRRRNNSSLTGVAKPPPAIEAKDSLAEAAADGKTRPDPNLHRGHTTTVNLGSGIADLATTSTTTTTTTTTKNERTNRSGFPEGRQQHQQQQHQQLEKQRDVETKSRGIQLRLENRIYDRLESYSSELLLLDSSCGVSTASSVTSRQSALKSARLVMNLSKVSTSSNSSRGGAGGRVTKIVIDNDVTRSWKERNFDDLSQLADDSGTKAPADEDDPGRYLDWQADREVRCIMLGSAAKEPENIHENSDTPRIENLAASEAIVESTADEEIKPTPLHSVAVVEPELVVTSEDCNVVCTDAENNRVLLKVVTTHEPTIARVESDHRRNKSAKSAGNVGVSAKKKKASSKCSAAIPRESKSREDHTYVNVFTGSKRAPIYENYKPIEPTVENKVATTDAVNSGPEKSPRVADTKDLKSRENGNTNFDRIKAAAAAPAATTEDPVSSAAESLVGSKRVRNKIKESKPKAGRGAESNGASCNATSSQQHSVASTRGRLSKQATKNPTPRSSVSSSETVRANRRASAHSLHARGNNSSASAASETSKDVASAKTTNKADALAKRKPIEVVYQTAVYNMKNEKLNKPQKGKESSKGPRYLNELICGAKIKRPSDSKSGKTSSVTQHGANNKSSLPPIKHWK